MNNLDLGETGQLVEFLLRPDGIFVVMKAGASQIPFDHVLAFARSSGLPRFDILKLRLAWMRSDGRPTIVAQAAQAPAPLDRILRTEDSAGEVLLVIDGPVETPTLNEVLEWLNHRHFSGLDLDLIREALAAPRGVAHRISRLHEAGNVAAAPRVLLSAADVQELATVATMLSQGGIEAHQTPGAELVVFEATQRLADAIILDTSLGIPAALKACRHLTTDPRTASIPVLVACRDATRELLAMALEAGARDLMAHPIAPAVLDRKLSKVLKATRSATAPPEGARGHDAPGLGRIDLGALLKRVGDLQSIPPVVERVVRISGDPEAGAKELARVVALDQVATTLVLQVANSAAFGAASRIATVANAITRIGFRQTRSLVVGKGIMESFALKPKSVGFDRLGCWRHALASAVLARQIAEAHPRVSSDLAFIAGLLHDVGKVLLDEFCATEFEEAVRSAIQRRMPLHEAERELLRTSHVEVGTEALKMWKFPSDIVDAVRFQLGVADEIALPADSRTLCLAVHTASLMAQASGIGAGGGDTFICEIADNVWERMALGRGLPGGFWTRFADEFRQCHSFLGVADDVVPGFVANRGAGLLYEDRPCPVGLLRIALESAGWTVTPISQPGSLPKRLASDAPAFAVARCLNGESLARVIAQSKPVIGSVPLVGVLPRGSTPPDGVTACLVEPYDRDDLLKLLP